jgi:uncharacterized protein YdeI (YjbR/CyaY-like superfamily)
MEMSRTVYVKDRQEWRAWLQKNSSRYREVWLIYPKRHTGKSRVAYAHAVEEALCFGWIDSNVQKIDEDNYAQKFTPRKKGSKWSALNKRRVAELIKTGRMTDRGLAAIDFSDEEDDYGRSNRTRSDMPVPEFMQRALQRSPAAWNNFQQMAPSYRRNYIGWISAAKTEETRNRRLEEAIALLNENRKLGMK